MIENAVVAYLKTQATITALVGTRTYYVKAPQEDSAGVLPYITVSKVSHLPSHSMGGDSGWINARIQISAHSKDYRTGKLIIQAIRNLFKDYLEGDSTVLMGGISWVQGINIDTETDLFDYDTEWHTCILDSFVMYQE